jgi:thioredoxin reductase (NADPH)
LARPVILTVDDDAEVLRAIERDLRAKYGAIYRIVRADSGVAALEVLRRLQKQNEAVALLLVDHRMPQMNGIETLAEAMKLFPEAKRVLLTAYADTEAAIRAINEVHLNHYLLKPWDPPDQHLYPVLDDLLEDWSADYRPPFEGVRVLGTRWSQKSYEVRDFLARNQIPYQWLDIEAADSNPAVLKALEPFPPADRKIPMILLNNGECLHQPDLNEIAERLGLQTRAGAEFYDLAIVGGGPAGLAAAVYGASEGLKTVMLESQAPGGQAGLSSRIENYLGFPSGLSGGDLARRAVTQARRFGVEILSPVQATRLTVDGTYRFLQLSNGTRISSHAVVLATGVQWRILDVPGMDRLQDAGVYYGAASTEALSCRDEEVYIVGGANSAGQAAMFFSKYAKRVVMLVRGPSLAATMSQYLIDQITQTPNIHLEVNTHVTEVHGENHLEEISLLCEKTGENSRVPATALFIFIGAEPRTAWLDGTVDRDAKGFILTGTDLLKDGKPPKGWNAGRDPYLLETSIPGVFAAGDVRCGSAKRVASGVGEGSVAVQFVHQYLSKVGA